MHSRILPLAFALCLVSSVLPAAEQASGARIRTHTAFLASDLLEGRGVGTRGGDLATEYIAAQLALAGAKPAGGGDSYFQPVPLTGVLTQDTATLTATKDGKSLPFVFRQDFVAATQRQRGDEQFQAEIVFVGHGITAPESQWNDYKTDVKGKVVLLFTNEPGTDNPALFEGRALTYYGRWTYKYEEALRHGALACLIIHTTPTAGYGWQVVRNSWSKEDPQVRLKPNEAALAAAGWLTRDAGERLLQMAGHSVDELLKQSESRDFQPIPLGIQLRASLPAKLRPIETRNVVGIFPGSDPQLAKEAIVYTAHWDHLGIALPVNNDAIYNGAIDNATGCGTVLELARIWGSLEQKPKRSALFLFVTAEESGLRGAEFYARNPSSSAKAILDLNYDALYPFGRSKDVIVTGAEKTPFWPLVQQAARRFDLEIQPDPRPEQGSYFRSDHFSFARQGVPAFSIRMGDRLAGQPDAAGAQRFNDFNAKSYHQPSDEMQPDWDFSGLEQMARFGFTIGLDAAMKTP